MLRARQEIEDLKAEKVNEVKRLEQQSQANLKTTR